MIVFVTAGSVGALANGFPKGILVRVSLVVGINDRKKLNDKKKFSKYLTVLFPIFLILKKQATKTKTKITNAKTWPKLKPPSFDKPNAVSEAINVQ